MATINFESGILAHCIAPGSVHDQWELTIHGEGVTAVPTASALDHARSIQLVNHLHALKHTLESDWLHSFWAPSIRRRQPSL